MNDLESLLFAKVDGSFRLVLWLETESADPKTGRVVAVPEQQITLSLPREYRARRVMTFDDSGAARSRTLSAAAPRLSVGDNLSIVEIAR